VIGGGMLGMELARQLQGDGHAVTLYERADELGGLAASWELSGFRWDRHYHVVTPTDDRTEALLAALDLELRWVTTRTGAYGNGQHYSVSSAGEFLRFPLLSPVDKMRLAATMLYASRISDGEKLSEIPVEDWLVRLSGRRVTDRFWMPLLRAKLGDLSRQTSAAFIWTVIRRLYAARTSGRRTEQLGYVPGGYGVILDAMSADLAGRGIDVRLGTPIDQVRADQGAVVVDTEAGRDRFDQVVVTAPAPVAGRLVAGLEPDEVQRLDQVPYMGVVCASVVLTRPLTDFYVTNLIDETPFTGVIEMTALIDPEEIGGTHLVYLPRYVAADDPLLDAPVEQIEETFLAGLRQLHPDLGDGEIVQFAVSRPRYVLPVPVIGYAARVPAMRTSVPGVWTVNSAQITDGTLNVDETLRLADRAMAEIRTATGSAGTRSPAATEPTP
jgi:protoporphyrinogen oxidase